MKEESEKVGFKLKIQKTKIMASGPITSWQIYGIQWKQEKEMATHSSTLAWMEEPGRLGSMGLLRVGHD